MGNRGGILVGRRRVFSAVAVILLAVMLAFSACHVTAVDHNDGETWTYDVLTSVDVGPYVVDLAGNITYEFQGQRALLVGTEEYHANVMSVEGELFGLMELFGEPFLHASVTIDGFLFETSDGAGIIREQTDMLLDATIGSGSGSWSIQRMNQSVVSYTPPYLSEFNAKSNVLGRQWTEEVTIDRAVTTWENGTEQGTLTSSSNSTYEITVGGNTFGVGTTAGNFECISIVIVDENGDYEVRWWSDDVHGCVVMDSYSDGAVFPDAYKMMLLASYEGGDSESMSWIILVGVCVTAAALAVLVVVLMRMRHPKDS